MLGNGNGTFQAPVQVLPLAVSGLDVTSVRVQLADMDGDGDRDLITLHAKPGPGAAVAVWRNNGTGAFAAPLVRDVPIPQFSFDNTDMTVGDINGDGRPDVVVSDVGGNNLALGGGVSVMRGVGDGSLTAPVRLPTLPRLRPYQVLLADMTRDGRPEIVAMTNGNGFVNESRSAVAIFRNDGVGNFGPATFYDHGGNVAGISATGDFNSDGAADVIVGHASTGGTTFSVIYAGEGSVQVTDAPVTVTGINLNPRAGVAFTTTVATFIDDNRDVERYLRYEPVDAGPPSAVYRFRKFARRHNREFWAASAFLATLIVATIGLAVSNVLIRREQARTASEWERAEKAQRLTEQRAAENRADLERLKEANAVVGRARVYIDLWQWDDADKLLTHATEVRPEYATAREVRGQLYTRLGLWDLAAADFAKEFELQEPPLANDWFGLALLYAYLGDTAGYHDICGRMIDHLGGTSRTNAAMELVRACSLGPESHGDPAQLVKIAAAVVDTQPPVHWFFHVLGVAHYRAGQYESAIRRLRESLDVDPNWPSRAINYPVLAMAYHRLSRVDESRAALDAAAQAIDHWTQQRYEEGAGQRVIYHAGSAFWPIPWWDLLQCQLQYREARSLLGLAADADDPRLQVLRARAFAGLGRSDRAVAEFGEARELNPDDLQIQLELQKKKGYFHASRREWKLAAAAFARASELQPAEPYHLHFQAVSHLADNDMDSYRRSCAVMLERFGETQDPRAAHSVAELCTLAPNAVADPTRLIPPARVASTWYPGASRILGAVQFRVGDFAAAVECLEAANEHHRSSASDLSVLSMAHHRLGNTDDARRRLAEATEWIDRANQILDNLNGTSPAWGRWDEQVVFPILRREAESLVMPPGASRSSGDRE